MRPLRGWWLLPAVALAAIPLATPSAIAQRGGGGGHGGGFGGGHMGGGWGGGMSAGRIGGGSRGSGGGSWGRGSHSGGRNEGSSPGPDGTHDLARGGDGHHPDSGWHHHGPGEGHHHGDGDDHHHGDGDDHHHPVCCIGNWWWGPFGCSPFFFDPFFVGFVYVEDGGHRRHHDEDGDDDRDEAVVNNIDLQMQPGDVRVYVNDTLASKTGRGAMFLPAGEYSIRIERDGYVPQTIHLQVQPGIRYQIQRKLQRLREETDVRR